MLRSVWSVIRRRPRTTALIVVLLALAGTGSGLYLYALRQWHEAELAVKESRLDDARGKLALSLRVWPRSPAVHFLAARAARLRGDFADAEAHLNRCKELEHGASDAVKLEFLLMRVQGGDVDGVAPELRRCVENDHREAPMILETLARAYLNNPPGQLIDLNVT